MRNWRKIVSDIYDVLSDYDIDVTYHKRTGHGYNAQCAYFSVSINEEWDWDWIESDVEAVCKKVESGYR